MSRIWSKLLFAFFYLFSLLPMGFLYQAGKVIAIVLRNVFAYRKKVIKENLERAFPELTTIQISRLTSRYYDHLAELMVEALKLFSASPEFLKKRVRYQNAELYETYYQKGQNIFLVMGHTGNWEWVGAATSNYTRYKILPVYRPLSSSVFDQLILKLRSRFGAEPLPMRSVLRVAMQENQQPFAMAFLGDQSAPPEHACWIRFLNQPTPVFRGLEKIVERTNTPVIFAAMRRESRGRYVVELMPVEGNGEPCSLTAAHTKLLEAEIRKDPVSWLWSHRRWKHTLPSGQTSKYL